LGNRRSVEKAKSEKARSKSNSSGVLRQTWSKEGRGRGKVSEKQKGRENH